MDVVKYMYVTGKFSALCVRGGKSFPSKFLVPCSCFCFFCICYLSRCVGKKHIFEISIAILFYFHWSSFIWILKMFHSWFVIYKMEFQIFFMDLFLLFLGATLGDHVLLLFALNNFFWGEKYNKMSDRHTIFSFDCVVLLKKIDHLPVFNLSSVFALLKVHCSYVIQALATFRIHLSVF